jgi:Ulp1 family protease
MAELVHGFDEAIKAVTYPEGDPGAFTITMRDIELLEPGTSVNDNIIEFYIKYD